MSWAIERGRCAWQRETFASEFLVFDELEIVALRRFMNILSCLSHSLFPSLSLLHFLYLSVTVSLSLTLSLFFRLSLCLPFPFLLSTLSPSALLSFLHFKLFQGISTST